MIVAIAGWLYIIQALLGLASQFSGPFGGGGADALATLLVSGAFGATGYGLLKRETWGRWLALGVSLLSWVFGSLMLLGLLAALVLSGQSGAVISMLFSGPFAIIGVLLVIGLLIMMVSVVISFKLFFHLCSEDGRYEFNAPDGSAAGTVVGSAGAWILLFIVQGFIAGGGGGGMAAMLARQALSRGDDRSAPDPERQRIEAQRMEDQRREVERRYRAEQEARERANRDAENQRALEAATVAEAPVIDTGYSTVAANVPAAEQPEEEAKTTANTILKCRDAAGSVTFTQGYCPPGTKRVDMSKTE